MRSIPWMRVALAVETYESRGFRHVSSPWVASEEAVRATYPEGHIVPWKGDTYLVGSAEQGLLDLALRGELPLEGLYVTAGPCFRWSDDRPPLHLPYFFKVELWGPPERLVDLIDTAEIVFGVMGPKPSRLETEEGTDLMLHGVEIGSYGIREYRGIRWSYGTGLAEPRYSEALRRQPS